MTQVGHLRQIWLLGVGPLMLSTWNSILRIAVAFPEQLCALLEIPYLGQKGDPSRASAPNTTTTDEVIFSQCLTWNTLLRIVRPYSVQLVIPRRTRDKSPTRVVAAGQIYFYVPDFSGAQFCLCAQSGTQKKTWARKIKRNMHF